jgi:hypothetical protein
MGSLAVREDELDLQGKTGDAMVKKKASSAGLGFAGTPKACSKKRVTVLPQPYLYALLPDL